MCRTVFLLHERLAPFQDRYHFIVSPDRYRAHMTAPVWRAMHRARFMYRSISTKLTWALQPYDTHVLSTLKDTRRHECQVRCLAAPDGALTLGLLVQSLVATMEDVLNGRSWGSALWELGLTGVKAAVSDRVLEKLDLAQRPCLSSALPTLQELQGVFPARTILPIDAIFGWFLLEARGHVTPASSSAHTADAPDIAEHPPAWHGRLRSSSSLAVAGAAARPPLPAWPPPVMSEPPPAAPPPTAPPRALPRARRLLPWRPVRPAAPPPGP